MEAFIETDEFPIQIVNRASTKEKGGGGRPPYWEMVFWWTRKPLAGARAVIAGALLSENINSINFANWLRLKSDKVSHRQNPILPDNIKEKFKKIKLLDPFAGFGSIPLEAIRLGIGEVVAVEFLPTAYIFLKAILEYPKKYGKKLISDVEKWGKWITEKLKEDPDIKELYDEDVAVYIGTWEVKCPICNRYTPLVGNWWLAKVKGKKYAYMKPKAEEGKVSIEIIEGKSSGALEPNVRGRPEKAICLLCGSTITYLDLQTGRIYRAKSEVSSKIVKNRLEFYPKHTIRQWNKMLEEYLTGKITLEELKQAPARPRLLIKVKIINKDLKFKPCHEEDNEKLWKALEKLKQLWGDPDIPTEPIPSYESRSIWVYPYGFNKFYKFFNPRQLLTLIKLVKLIREAGKRIEDEKYKEGWNMDDAFKYAEAVTTYLAIALINFARHNALVNHWEGASWQPVRHVLAMRGIAMQWNWCDVNPHYEESLVSYQYFNNKNVDSLSYLVSAVSDYSGEVRVFLDDATVLNKLDNEKFDVIVTDPPYRDDVPYTELSDFYYVWLKRALSDDNLKPRFHADALAYNTQWESFALNEVSYNEGRLRYFGVQETEDYYEKLMGMAFRKMSELLKDDGLIVTYFAHSSPEAWTELIEAGWRRAKLKVTKAWAFATESEQRVTARGKTALESSIIVVWRKRKVNDEKIEEYREVYSRALERAEEEMKSALTSGLTQVDLLIASMTGALSEFTSYDKITRFGVELTPRDIIKEAYAIAARVISGATEAIRSPEALFYLASKAMYGKYSTPKGQLSLETRTQPIILSSQDIIILSYGFLREEAEKNGYKIFLNSKIVKPLEETSGANVARQKTFTLLEPLESSLEAVKKLLGERGLNPIKLEAEGRQLNSIDILHLLEYYALQGRGEFSIAYRDLYGKYPQSVREAIEVAKIIKDMEMDPEKDLAERVIEYIKER